MITILLKSKTSTKIRRDKHTRHLRITNLQTHTKSDSETATTIVESTEKAKRIENEREDWRKQHTQVK